MKGLFCLWMGLCAALQPPLTVAAAYYPPFQKGQKIFISQGFGGSKTHYEQPNYYAVDLLLKEGAWVCAAWSGKVVGLRYVPDAKDDSNYVRILHDTGQIGDYQHLKAVKVSLGQRVKLGECFAKVGVNGYTTGPHLHFAILVPNKRGTLVSIPFYFLDVDNKAYTPVELQWINY